MIYVNAKSIKYYCPPRGYVHRRGWEMISYGPFENEHLARKWVEWRGVLHATYSTIPAGRIITVRNLP